MPHLVAQPVTAVASPLSVFPDTWPPGALDVEPEPCWCLACGQELPCPPGCQFVPSTVNQTQGA
jgi:hypothetical protein